MKKKILKIIFFIFCWIQFILLLSSCKKNSGDDCPNCPSVLSLSPDHAYGGDTISLSGRNFSSDFLGNIVKFNGTTVSPDKIINGSSTQLSVVVPIGCGSGPVTVDLDAELTNTGTPPNFTYLFKAAVSTFAGSWNDNTHVVNTSVSLTRFTSPGGIVIYDDVIFVQDGINTITKISNFSQSTDVTLNSTEDINNIFPGTGKVYYLRTVSDVSQNWTYSVDDITLGMASPVCDTTFNGTNVSIPSLATDNSGHFIIVYNFYDPVMAVYDSMIIVKSDNLNSFHGNVIFRTVTFSIFPVKFKDGYIYGLNRENNKIYKISAAGSVSQTYSLDISFAAFAITDFIIDKNGKIYFVSGQNNKVYYFTSTTTVSEVAGGLSSGHDDGIGNHATFNYPNGIAIAGDGTIYVSDGGNYSIRKITLQ